MDSTPEHSSRLRPGPGCDRPRPDHRRGTSTVRRRSDVALFDCLAPQPASHFQPANACSEADSGFEGMLGQQRRHA